MFARHITLAANTVATITLDRNYPRIEVLSRDGAAEVYYTRDGSTPTVGGNNTYVLPAAIGGLDQPRDDAASDVVKLISAAAVRVSVLGW